MAWVRIDDNVPTHRKHLKAGPSACWLWVCAIAYSQRQLTDGFIPHEALALLGVAKGYSPLADKLVEVGLFERRDDGYQVHDYHDHNAHSDDVKRERAERSEMRARAGRAGGLRSGEVRSKREANVKQTDEANVKQTEAACRSKREAPSHPIPSHSSVASQQKTPRPTTFGRIDLHRWQIDALIAALGPHAATFDLDAWVLDLSKMADARGLVLSKQTLWPWVQAEFRAECDRRQLPTAVASEQPQFGKQSSRLLAAVAKLEA